MQAIQVDRAADNQVRFVFDGVVKSFSVAADATFAEIARMLGDPSNRRFGHPVAIDVTLAAREGGADGGNLRSA